MVQKKSIREWLGFSNIFDYEKARTLGAFFGWVLSVLALIFIAISVIALILYIQAAFGLGKYQHDRTGEALRNTGLVFAALVGIPFIIWRAIVAARQVDVAAESLFNDKISAASSDLNARYEETSRLEVDGDFKQVNEWKADTVARSAAIDRLEGLAFERRDTAPRIARLLATYIKGSFPAVNVAPTVNIRRTVQPRIDLQFAVSALSRVHRIAREVDNSEWRLNLTHTNFDGVNFAGTYFYAADFSNSRFEGVNFVAANLEGCKFSGCLLNYGRFIGANMRGCRFDRAIINEPEPHPHGMVESINLADIFGTTFVAADIRALDYIGEREVLAATLATSDTRLSKVIEDAMPALALRRSAMLYRADFRSNDRVTSAWEQLKATGFEYWLPFSSTDLMLGNKLGQFRAEHGLDRFPYT